MIEEGSLTVELINKEEEQKENKINWISLGPYLIMFILCGLLFIFYAATPLDAISFSAKDDPILSAKFNPLPQGWMGADVSVSIPLGNNIYLWLWGDTLVGNIAKDQFGNQYRNLSAFPHSSMAIVNMSGSQNPQYSFQRLPNSQVVDSMGLFRPDNPSNPKEFYWTVGGVVSPSTQHLIVTTQVIIDTNSGIGFEQIGTDIVIVANPLRPLEEWTYTTSRIPSSSTTLSWNSGIAFDEGYFYLVGLANSSAYLARISESDMLKFNWPGMTYWSKGNQWRSDTNDLLALYKSVYTEGTLQYHPYMKRWYNILAQAYQGSISIAYAPNITGPYTVDPVYTIPKGYQNGTFTSYAGKSHPEYANSNEIVFTYNVNANSLSLLFKDLDIYHPKFVRVSISLN